MKHFINRFLKTVFIGFWYLAVILLIGLLAHILGAKLQGQVPSFMGYSLMRVISGSMEPSIPSGSYILIQTVSPEDIRKGEIICFYSDDPLIPGMPNTHRVIGDPIPQEDGFLYPTKGDSNVVPDKVYADSHRLIGKYVKKITWLNRFSQMLSGKSMLAIIIVIQVASAGMMLVSVLTMKKRMAKHHREE